jgi:hypothetical protein
MDPRAISLELIRSRVLEHVHGPGTDKHLIEHVFVDAIGRGHASHIAASRAQDAVPVLNTLAPFLRQFR